METMSKSLLIRTYDVLATLWNDVFKNPQVWLAASLIYLIWVSTFRTA